MISKAVVVQGISKYVIAPIRHWKLKKAYKDRQITFISSNCAGGVLSHDCGMQMCSPTINLWMSASDYIKFAENLDYYLAQPFAEAPMNTNYPVGCVGDVVLHCIHYCDFEEAKQKWETRKSRINRRCMVFTFTDQNDCTPELVNRFMHLPYPKIFFTSDERYRGYQNCVWMDSKEYRKKHNGRTLVDDAFLYQGLSGKRNYERFLNVEELLKQLTECN